MADRLTLSRASAGREQQLRPVITVEWPTSMGINPHQIEAAQGWHCREESGPWDVQMLRTDHESKLIHSHAHGKRNATKPTLWHTLVFELEEGLFAVVSQHLADYASLRVWAKSSDEAEVAFHGLRQLISSATKPPAFLNSSSFRCSWANSWRARSRLRRRL